MTTPDKTATQDLEIQAPESETPKFQASDFQTSRVATIAFAHFVHDLYTSFLAPLLPLIIEKLSLTLSQAGLLSTVMQIPSLANPFIGLFADNKGLARWLVILAPTLTAIPMSLIGIAPSYEMLLVLVFVAGISVSLFHVPAPVTVARYSGKFKGRGMSFFMTGGEFARTMGPIGAVGAVSFLGLARFHFVLVLALATSVMLFMALEPSREPVKAKRRGSLTQAYKEVSHVLNPLAAILSARAMMHGSMGMFLTVYVEQATGSLWLGGTALTLYEATGVAGILSAGTLSDRLGRQRVLFWALAVAPVSILLFTLTSGVIQIISLLVTGFTVLSTTPVMLALVQENAEENPAAANGLFMMISFAVRSLAVVAAGAIADAFGMNMMFIIAALAGFTAIPFLIKLKK
ncbi:MFS transporter [uncultured Desulfobacter sp.]|uniref:MFS transporter n=1 Tax=uncultured Desulfobacter sp. TaxID=240139 RepID=UPI002AAA8D74|nr:MFS transporter [uncultured Desulfobacter sp.]